MTARISAEDAAGIIWAALDRAGSDGITKADLLVGTGLTPGQWHNGLAYLKDFLQENHEQPLAIIQPGYRYALSQHVEESKEYLLLLMTGLLSRLTRAEHGTSAFVSKFVPADGKVLEKTYRRLVEDLDDAIHLLAGSEAA